MKPSYYYLTLFIVLITSSACDHEPTKTSKDPLPSWNEGPVKTSIIQFVKSSTQLTNKNFIEIEDRIATFDNDGNLWSEQPYYFQLKFAIDRIINLADQHPEWEKKYPYRAVLENDMDKLISFGEHGLLELVMATHTGMSTQEFNHSVQEWLRSNTHPRFKVPYNELVYQPMLELITYLQANQYKTFIVSGGGVDFMRVWTEEAYNIPPDRVIGSSLKAEFVIENGEVLIKKLPAINFIDDKEGKPIGIHQYIGKKPVFASGNSDGDLQMLQYAASGNKPSFMLYLHHTDSIREWAYDRDSHIGRLDKGLDMAHKEGWAVIDMAKDWKVIYPFQLKK
ncbi:HAD family phosphatase [Carboxylicivirga sp. M1479]|uniref:HAD family hydrolase n=1 Tax=Carboxylicivirga sp. M1479 TaxID=2594476 RepID=UPI00117736D3|nr:HAD family hydrolase [Carboxylicivirga sp. M1479]TRX72122.1 haloacid dehalogenase-like hydrolase [Carboxylicivirga sp. M1479]